MSDPVSRFYRSYVCETLGSKCYLNVNGDDDRLLPIQKKVMVLMKLLPLLDTEGSCDVEVVVADDL
jgi:hypothetical protein